MLVDILQDTLFEVAKPSLRSEVEQLSGPWYEASRTWAETRHDWEVEITNNGDQGRGHFGDSLTIISYSIS